ncbi:MAG: serine--tRNA ligase [Actinobacteria bacterium]|uniref:serine--tRNA ligase n=2 Tax=freshwater metagenome TaxID=449393 RepID=A0A6J6I6X6_9ZZZZ|nr:serine--tRNA ligase [Actinomycetota bacterium]MTA66275.1 serine--tRNA ligase [Actinomycetota bacterium]
MIDVQLLRNSPDTLRASQRDRGEDVALVDEVLHLDEERRTAGTAFDELRAAQKNIGKDVAKAQGEEKTALLEQAKTLADEVKAAQDRRDVIAADFDTKVLAISNVVDDAAPRGGEEDFVVLEEVGTPRTFDFEPRDHLELGEMLGAIDVERAAKVSGSRFYYLTGVGAQLEFALVNMAMDLAMDAGFTLMVPPVLVKPTAMEGTGFLGQAAENVYRVESDDLYLVGTAEVPLAAYHSDEILDAKQLPLRYAAFSSCFRREAGTYGKDTRGIIRVHQFDKVEMFAFVDPADALAEHQRLLAWEKDFLNLLEVPYRVIDVATGDLGASATRKFDCEAWIPTQGKYREVTSASNCTQFQARRLGVRMRGADQTQPVSTLNGTLCAIPRTIVSILENHQNADGSVTLPAALRPYMRNRSTLDPIA